MANRVTWTAEADRNLFLSILKVHNISVNYEGVAANLASEHGMNCTPKAVSQRFAKLKAVVKSSSDAKSDDADANEADQKTKAGKHGKGNKKRAADDDDEDATVDAKARKGRKKAPAPQTAADDEDGADAADGVKDESSD